MKTNFRNFLCSESLGTGRDVRTADTKFLTVEKTMNFALMGVAQIATSGQLTFLAPHWKTRCSLSFSILCSASLAYLTARLKKNCAFFEKFSALSRVIRFLTAIKAKSVSFLA